MKGIQFVIDDRGEKTAVVIDLKEHAEIWRRFHDDWLLDAQHRAEIQSGVAEADSGDFAEDAEVAAVLKKWGVDAGSLA